MPPTSRSGPDLLPCPFCGTAPRVKVWPNDPYNLRGSVEVSCENNYCPVQVSAEENSVEAATANWNARIAAASENRTQDPAPLELVTDPEREDNWAGKTDILVRAKLPDGSFGSVDIAELDRASLWTWLRSRGGRNLWAENVILIMLSHNPITESEDAANR